MYRKEKIGQRIAGVSLTQKINFGSDKAIYSEDALNRAPQKLVTLSISLGSIKRKITRPRKKKSRELKLSIERAARELSIEPEE